ncbi:hypothetical protein DFH28DRAFT_947894 [Melampsora americana]|nr:hypothetical protein DFH28DRAFT_947894 [Melampsora americana]
MFLIHLFILSVLSFPFNFILFTLTFHHFYYNLFTLFSHFFFSFLCSFNLKSDVQPHLNTIINVIYQMLSYLNTFI